MQLKRVEIVRVKSEWGTPLLDVTFQMICQEEMGIGARLEQEMLVTAKPWTGA